MRCNNGPNLNKEISHVHIHLVLKSCNVRNMGWIVGSCNVRNIFCTYTKNTDHRIPGNWLKKPSWMQQWAFYCQDNVWMLNFVATEEHREAFKEPQDSQEEQFENHCTRVFSDAAVHKYDINSYRTEVTKDKCHYYHPTTWALKIKTVTELLVDRSLRSGKKTTQHL